MIQTAMLGMALVPFIKNRAWTDLDLVYGNMDYFFNNNLAHESDIFTIGAGDLHRNYLRGQFTAHNLQRRNVNVNELWRDCEYFETIESTTRYLSMSDKRKLAAGMMNHVPYAV